MDVARRLRSLVLLLTLAVLATSPLHAGAERWTPAGPPVPGAAQGLSFDPLTPGTLYLAAGDGGLYVSTDGGDDWRHLDAAPSGLEAPLVGPFAPRTLYANRGDASVWKSADGGASWRPLPDAAKRLLAIDPATGALYASNGGTRLLRSVDGGATFTAVTFDIPIFGSDLFAVAIDRAHPGTIYVSTSDALYRSSDGGVHWTAGGSIDDFGPADLVVAPAGGAVLYGRAFYSSGMPPCFVRSTDAGSSWTAIDSPVSPPSPEGCVWAVDPLADRTIHVLAGSAADPGARRAFTSRDAGATWQEVGEGPAEAQFLAIDPLRPAVWYAGTLDRGIFRSVDSGHTFTAINQGLAGGSFDLLAAAPAAPTAIPARSALYAGAQGGGLFVTRTAGRTWRPLTSQRVTTLAVDPANPFHLVAGLTPGDPAAAVFAFSTDAGVSFVSPGGGAGQPAGVTRLAFDPTNPRVLYAGTVAGEIWKSADGGQHWQRFGKGLPVLAPCDQTFCPTQPVAALVVDPTRPQTVYAVVGGHVFKSVNGGRRFGASGRGLDGAGVESLIQDPAQPATLWAGGCSGVWKSLDAGASWSPSSEGLPIPAGQLSACVTALLSDPNPPRSLEIVYAALDGAGVFRSLDGGDTWSPLNQGLGNLRVEALALETSANRLWAATHGNGLYVATFTLP